MFKIKRKNVTNRARSWSPAAVLSLALVFSMAGAACQNDEASPQSGSTKKDSLWSRLTSSDSVPMVKVPEGTRIYVRLEDRVSSSTSHTGDQFRATLDRPISVDGKKIGAKGDRVTGHLVEVKQSGRVEGRAEVILTLEKLTIKDDDYTIATHPLTVRASSGKNKDAKVIGGASAVGAIIGAIAGGGKGAAIGAAVGAGSGSGYVLATRGKSVDFRPETLFAFTLEEATELPAPAAK